MSGRRFVRARARGIHEERDRGAQLLRRAGAQRFRVTVGEQGERGKAGEALEGGSGVGESGPARLGISEGQRLCSRKLAVKSLLPRRADRAGENLSIGLEGSALQLPLGLFAAGNQGLGARFAALECGHPDESFPHSAAPVHQGAETIEGEGIEGAHAI